MTGNHLLLRYGDYLKHNLHVMKKFSQETAKKDSKADKLAGVPWAELGETLKEEDTQMDVFREDGTIPRRATPMTDLIKELAELSQMTFNEARFDIDQYAKRCHIAHSGIDDDVANNRLTAISQYIVRDRVAIQNGILVDEMAEMKNDLLRVLKIFERRFFDRIYEGVDPETGITIAISYQSSKEEVAREEAARMAELEKKVNAMKLDSFSDDLVKAMEMEEGIEEVLQARDDLLGAAEILKTAKTTLKSAQAEWGKAEKGLREQP
jgi:hypothetical protein